MKIVIPLFILIIFSGCSSYQYKNDWDIANAFMNHDIRPIAGVDTFKVTIDTSIFISDEETGEIVRLQLAEEIGMKYDYSHFCNIDHIENKGKSIVMQFFHSEPSKSDCGDGIIFSVNDVYSKLSQKYER
tara:strand:- start:47 stop:436 length:390 start_codon:yes stop_codon:yes gene_type:complete